MLLDPVFSEYLLQRKLINVPDEFRGELRKAFFVGAHATLGLVKRATALEDRQMLLIFQQLGQETDAAVKETFRHDSEVLNALNNNIGRKLK